MPVGKRKELAAWIRVKKGNKIVKMLKSMRLEKIGKYMMGLLVRKIKKNVRGCGSRSPKY